MEEAVTADGGEDVAQKRDVKAQDIYKLLKKRYDDERQWLCAGEVSNSTGYNACRRLDFVAVNCYESKGYGIHAFEIKISKSDLRRELEDPTKHNIFFEELDTYSIIAPDYVLDAEYKSLIQPKWGIYVVAMRNVKDAVSGETHGEMASTAPVLRKYGERIAQMLSIKKDDIAKTISEINEKENEGTEE